ncbi:cytochrome P450 [Nocardia sp. NBC_01377]|uniref:cytochrome P450 n=1 Tax=Nocardia sp. NBC_01377 TaxID=2903595 RepID=UPI00324F5EF4
MSTTTQVPIDLWSSASFDAGHPVEQYHWLLDNAPVYWHDEPDGRGFWAVTKAELVRYASRLPEVFANRNGMTMYDLDPESLVRLRRMIMFMDPPEHAKWRRLVANEFTPRGAGRWAPFIDDLVEDILDEVSETGECELMTQVAGLLPSYVVAELLGVSRADGVRLYELTEIMHSALDAVTNEQRQGAQVEMMKFCTELHAAKLDHPDETLASRIAHAELDDTRIDVMDFNMFILLLINGGGDTVRNCVGSAVLSLLDDPRAMSHLRAESEELRSTSTEEFLRFQSPAIFQRRTATQNTRLGDVDIAEGDKVLLYYGAANRDPSVFANPDELVLDRDPNPHMAFGGHGPHYCLGAHIARLEISAMMGRLVTRLPDLRLAGEPTWLASNFISGPTYVPVEFTPTPRVRNGEPR